MMNAEKTQAEAPPLRWERRVSLLRSNPVTRQILMALGIPFALLLLWMAKNWLLDGRQEAFYAFCFAGGFLVIACAFVLAVFGGAYAVEYCLDARGIASANQREQSRRLSALYKFGMFLSLLSRRPGMSGAALLANSSLKSFMSWKSLKSAEYRPKERLIIVRASGLDKAWLFCTEENYEAVRARVESRLAANNRKQKQGGNSR